MDARCPTCGGEVPCGRDHAQPVVLVPDSVPHCNDELLSVGPEAFADAEFRSEFEQLTMLALVHVENGVHLNDYLRKPLRNPLIIRWQVASNEKLACGKGRRDLVRKRRYDVLRWTSGPDSPLPYVKPEFAYLPEHASVQNRVFRLRDEAEWLVIPTISTKDPRMPWRPVREVLTHEFIRAILDWKASHLDMYLSAQPHLIGGRLCHELPADQNSTRQHIHEVKFSASAFMKWYFANMN
jgi:hypothetical protein